MRILAILFLVAACGPGKKQVQDPKDPMPPEVVAIDAGLPPDAEVKEVELPGLELIEVTVVAAELEGRMANGEDWDKAAPLLSPTLFKPLLRYMRSHFELRSTAAYLGVPVTSPNLVKSAADSPAADPMVFMQIDKWMFRSPAQLKAFSPLWEFPFVFAYGFSDFRQGVVPGSLVRISVVDYDGPTRFESMGTTILTVDELIGKSIHTLGPFGSVKSLTLQVHRSTLDEERNRGRMHRLAVPGKPSWTDTGLTVTAGQRLVIEAADEVCTAGDNLKKCSGPEGQNLTNKKNLVGFKKLGHGALVGSLGDTRFYVGRKRKFVAPSSGVLRLGINDEDTDNNSGSYEVRVTIKP